VEPEKVVKVDRLAADTGDEIELDRVLMVRDEGKLRVGTPYVKGAAVRARVVQQGRGKKIIVQKFKAKKRYRRKVGHRQHFTALQIMDITG